jgi:aminoglycoside phosphotransferase family enzyme
LRRFISSHRQSLDNRARDGYVRDGHGDLRCDSVCFSPAGLAIIDCVEYSEKLRYVDAASEVASLTLDLKLARRCDLADELVAAYTAETGDAGLPALLRFYQCYRAILRGKLEMLLSLQKALPTERRMLARSNASRFFAFAESHVTASRGALFS